MSKKIKHDADEKYCGYYNGHMYAMSSSKKLVKHYMESHRQLSPGEYTIQLLDDSVISASNYDVELYEYHGVYIADRDISMIELFYNDFKHEMYTTYKSLVSLTKIINLKEDLKKETKTLLEAIKTLSKLSKDRELLSELDDLNRLDNPIIYSKITEYDSMLNHYNDYIGRMEHIKFMD